MSTKYKVTNTYTDRPEMDIFGPAENLNDIIEEAFSMARSAAMRCAKCTTTVWEETGVGANPWNSIGSIAINFSKIPFVLLNPPPAPAPGPLEHLMASDDEPIDAVFIAADVDEAEEDPFKPTNGNGSGMMPSTIALLAPPRGRRR